MDVSGAYAQVNLNITWPVENLKVWRSVCLPLQHIDVCEVINVENLHTFMHEEWESGGELGID